MAGMTLSPCGEGQPRRPWRSFGSENQAYRFIKDLTQDQFQPSPLGASFCWTMCGQMGFNNRPQGG